MKQVTMFRAVVRNLSPHAMTRRVFDALRAAQVPVKMSSDGLSLEVESGCVRTRMTDSEIIYRWYENCEPIEKDVLDHTIEGFRPKIE